MSRQFGDLQGGSSGLYTECTGAGDANYDDWEPILDVNRIF